MWYFFILFIPYFTHLGESREILISHDEELVENIHHLQEFNGRNISTIVYRIKEVQSHPFMQMCWDRQVNLIYIFAYESSSVSEDNFKFYLIELETNYIYQHMYQSANAGLLNHFICKHGLLLFTFESQPGIWTQVHKSNITFHDNLGRVTDVITNEEDPIRVAIVTEQRMLYYLNIKDGIWLLVSEYSTEPHW
ncbi:hypothetical protein RF11_06991 [Thelohanellus kitauei]|uniref:Uncharacterized protein n=1 Tax=Thelohanellus kitauei TaxID=669202 RepID=A0A0C2N2S4_THEKT|nr:hypothetical protein RF11_06991 [Thelohanellus kitauei]